MTPWTPACQVSLSITNTQSLPKLMSFESVISSNHLILCHPLLFLPSIFPSIRIFSNESTLSIRWPKYWSFGFNLSPSSEHLGLISFRMDRLDLPAVQGTLNSLLSTPHTSFIIWSHKILSCTFFGLSSGVRHFSMELCLLSNENEGSYPTSLISLKI